jgi:hypothetical protein
MRNEPACNVNRAPVPRRGAWLVPLFGATLLLGLGPVQSGAQEAQRLYQVEVVIFAQPAGTSVELPPLQEAPATEPEADAEPAPEAEMTPDPGVPTELSELGPVLPIGVSGPVAPRQLDAVARRLDTGGYRLLWHQAWVQPALGREGLELETLAALGQGVAAPELSGTIRLSAGRFMHLGMAIELESEHGLEATLQQQRRVRLGDEHYFDHPHIGVIAVVNRHETDGDQSAP